MKKSLYKFLSKKPLVCAWRSIHDPDEVRDMINFIHAYSLQDDGFGSSKYDAFVSFAHGVSAHSRIMTEKQRPGDEAAADIGIDDAIMIYNQVLAMKRF